MLQSLPDSIQEYVIQKLSYTETHLLSQVSRDARAACTRRMRFCLSMLHGRKYRMLRCAFGVGP